MYFPDSNSSSTHMPIQVIYAVVIVSFFFILICFISCYFKYIYKCCCGHTVQWDRLEEQNQPLLIGNSTRQNIRILTSLPKNIKLAVDPQGKILLANTVINSSPRLGLGGVSEVSHTPVLYQTELSTDGTESIDTTTSSIV